VNNIKSNTNSVIEEKIKKMVKINAGSYFIGTDNPVFVADGEGPKREVVLDNFYIDKFEVSNKEFMMFVKATDYITEAENFGDSFVFEGFLTQTTKDKINKVVSQAPWWLLVKQTSWQHPEGPNSNITCTYKNKNGGNYLEPLPPKILIKIYIQLHIHLKRKNLAEKRGDLPRESSY